MVGKFPGLAAQLESIKDFKVVLCKRIDPDTIIFVNKYGQDIGGVIMISYPFWRNRDK